MKLNDIQKNYVFYTEIDLGEGEFLKLREPTTSELNDLNKANDDARIEELSKLFPICLVDHSFKNDDGEKSKNDAVYNGLKQSGSMFIEIITTWLDALPFNSRLKKEQK
jgi:hypothetical protein